MAFSDQFDMNRLLSFEVARLQNYVQRGQDSDSQVLVEWDVPNSSVDQCLAWLYANRESVSDVDVEYQTLDGIWRNVQVVTQEAEKGLTRIVMTLARGYATSLNWSEARIVNEVYSNENEDPTLVSKNAADLKDGESVITVRFPNIDPDSVSDVASTMSEEYASFTVRGKTYTPPVGSTWTRVMSTAQITEDGSGEVQAVFALPMFVAYAYSDFDTPKASDTTHLFRVPKQNVQAILDAHRVQEGATAAVSYSDDARLADIILTTLVEPEGNFLELYYTENCRYKVRYIYKYNLTETEAGDLATFIDAYHAPGVTANVRIFENRTGRFDATIEIRYRQVQNVPVHISRISPLIEETTKEDLGITSMPADPVEEQGVIKRMSVRRNADCTNDVTTVEVEAQPIDPITTTSGGPVVRVDSTQKRNELTPEDPGQGPVGEIYDVTNNVNEYGLYDSRVNKRIASQVGPINADSGGPLVTETEKHTRNASTPSSPGAGSAGTINNVSNNINEFGYYDVRENTRTANKSGPHGTDGGSVLVDESVEVTRNDTAPASPGSGVAGTINSASTSLNDFGLFDNRVTVRTAKESGPHATAGGGPIVSTSSQITRNAASPASPGAGSAGTINDVSTSQNEYGLFDNRVTVRTATTSGPHATSGGGPLVETSNQVTRNALTPADPGPGAVGTINDASTSVNEFGLFDNRVSVRTAVIAGPASTSAGGPLATESVEVTRNASSPASPGAGSVGTINSASTSINEFGLHDNRVTTRTAVSAGPVQSTSGGSLTSETTDVARNQSSPANPGIGAVGQITSASNSINEFGLYDTRLTTRTATQASTDHTDGGPLVSSSTTVFQNETAKQDPGAGGIGEIKSASNRKNEYGLFDSTLNTRTAVAAESPDFLSGGPLQTTTEHLYRNQSAPRNPGPASIGEIKRVSNRLNDFKLYDATETTVAATAFGPTTSVAGTPLEIRTTTGNRNSTSIETPGAGTQGTIFNATNSVNEFGLYDTTKVERTAVAVQDSFDYVTRWGNARVYVGRNCTSAQFSAVLSDLSNIGSYGYWHTSASFNINEFGLYDYTCRANPSQDQDEGTFTSPSNTRIQVERRGTQRREVTYTYTIKKMNSGVGAYNFMNGALQGSSINRSGDGWFCEKVTQIDYGAWVSDEGGTIT